MNYYAARRLLNPDGTPTKLYHYTCQRDKRVWPVGGCREGCSGHPTPEEAQAHYREHLLRTARFWGPKTTEWPKQKCAVSECPREATHCGGTGPGGMYVWEFCSEHATPEGVDRVLGSVGEITASY
jgi:hypothetical protein